MRSTIRLVSLAALLVSIAWLAYRPAFDSGLATITTLATFLSSFLPKKAPADPGAKQSQKISSGSIGIQAGGNVRIEKMGGCKGNGNVE
jgi:hypothetical protein